MSRTRNRAMPRAVPVLATVALSLLLAACDRRAVEDDVVPTPAADTAVPEAGTPPPVTDIEIPAAAITPEPPDPLAGAASPAPAPAATAVSQADALALLMSINEYEIAAAAQALGRNVTGAVRAYAQMMKTDHEKNLTDSTRLGGAVSTAPEVTRLREQGERDLRELGAQPDAAYAKAYIDAMVVGHTDALAMIDGTLLPAASDDNVRQHFTTTRMTVARHLQRAKEIQASLK